MALEINNEELFNKVVSNAVEKALTTCSTERLAKRWERAIDRAVTEIQDNPFLHYDTEKNELLIVSSSSNNIYCANGVCQCLAFLNGYPCWHRAAARVWRLYLEAENTPPPVPAKAAAASVSSFHGAPYMRQSSNTKPMKLGNIKF